MNVTGYPTLFYYRNADDATLRTEELYQPIKYEGRLPWNPFQKTHIFKVNKLETLDNIINWI